MNALNPVKVATWAALEKVAQAHGAAMTVVAEDWKSITYEVTAEYMDGAVRVRYIHRIPPAAALRRWERTFIVGLHHRDGAADCTHVRHVMAPTTGPGAPDSAVLVAMAVVEREKRAACGATAATLTAHLVVRAAEWTGD
ncbi:hypothetical protein [Nocardiopsis chromatogenes]|uniref:hypothetical protein n=1 Tax=Nocardiopsis chromatogenes TaxID=280239 RepID=UPI00034D5E58|nr:hypothetical protein [Nocardiopsis chromatogenes]